jgi:hypothetical protein
MNMIVRSAAAIATVPAIAQATPNTDAELLKLEEQIFEHKNAADELGMQAAPLDVIWCKENHRLHDEFEANRCTGPTFDERKAIVEAMPEFKECMRLRELQARGYDAADELVAQMWKIKAQTPEGRRAKLLVLLGYVMEGNEWRCGTWETGETFDVIRARDLMIEFVDGEPAEQLRDQFA